MFHIVYTHKIAF